MADFVFDIDIRANYDDEGLKTIASDLERVRDEAKETKESLKDATDSASILKRESASVLEDAAESARLELSDLFNVNKKTARGNYVFRGREIEESAAGINREYVDAITARTSTLLKLTKMDEHSGVALEKAISALPEEYKKTFESINGKIRGAVLQSYNKIIKPDVTHKDNTKQPSRNLDVVVSEMVRDNTLQNRMSEAGLRFTDKKTLENYLKASLMRNVGITQTQDFMNAFERIDIKKSMRDILSTTRDKAIFDKQRQIKSKSDYSFVGKDYIDPLAYYYANTKQNNTTGDNTHFGHRRLNDAGFARFASIIKNNPKLAEIAVQNGLATYDTSGGKGSGMLKLNRDITVEQIFGSTFDEASKSYNGFLPSIMKEFERRAQHTLTAGYVGENHRGEKRGNPWTNSNDKSVEENFNRYFNNVFLNGYNKLSEFFEDIVSYQEGKGFLTNRTFTGDSFLFDGSSIANTIKLLPKESYDVQKISPFTRKRTNAKKNLNIIDEINKMIKDPFRTKATYDEDIIPLEESEITRLIDRATNGSLVNKERNDVFKLISLAGFDNKNEKDMADLNKIIETYSKPDSEYMFAGSHGSGQDTIVRLVKRTVAEQTNQFAAKEAIEYFKQINPAYTEDYLRKSGMLKPFENAITGGFDYSSINKRIDLNKALDAGNKIWTPSTETSRPAIANLKGKRILVIKDGEQKKILDDYGSKLTQEETALDAFNGQMILSTGVFGQTNNAALQTRFGVAGKGSAVYMDDPVSYLRKTGITKLKGVIGAEEGFDITNEDIAAIIPESVLKNRKAIKDIIERYGKNSKETIDAIDAMMKVEAAIAGVGSMKNLSTLDDADNIGSQLGRQIHMDPIEQKKQSDILNLRVRRMRNGDAREILNTIYNGGSNGASNPNVAKLSSLNAEESKYAALSPEVQRDVENYYTAKTQELLRGVRTVFDIEERGGYKQRAVLSNNTFREFINNDWGSDEAIKKLSALTKDARKESDQARMVDNFIAWAKSKDGLSKTDIDALGITDTPNETSDYLVSKLLSLEGRYKKDSSGKFVKTSDVFFSSDSDAAIAPYRNPAQYGETKPMVNVSGILSRYFDYLGDYNGSGFMANASNLKLLAGADNDGDIVKMIGIRGLRISKMIEDLGLDNSETTKLDIAEQISTLDKTGNNFAIVENYSEQIRTAIKRNNDKLKNENISSRETQEIKAQTSAYEELLNGSSTFLSVVKEDAEVKKYIEEAYASPKVIAERAALKASIKGLDENSGKNIVDNENRISTVSEYIARMVGAPASMGATSNIGAKFAAYIANERQVGGSLRGMKYAAQSLFGNYQYDKATTEGKKETELKYLNDIMEASKIGNTFSRISEMFKRAEVTLEKSYPDKKANGRIKNVYVKAGEKIVEGQHYPTIYDDQDYNKEVVRIRGTNRAYDLSEFIKTVDSGRKDVLGYNTRQEAWNQMGFTAADQNARIAGLLAYKENSDWAEEEAKARYVAYKALADTDPIFAENNDYGHLSKNSAVHQLMLDWGKILAEESVGKRMGISDKEANSLLLGVAEAEREISDAAENFTKYGSVYVHKNRQKKNLSHKEYQALNEDEQAEYALWTKDQFVNEYKKSTPINAIIATLGAALDRQGNGIGSTGSLTSEFITSLETYRTDNEKEAKAVQELLEMAKSSGSGSGTAGSTFDYEKLNKNERFNIIYGRLTRDAAMSGINVVGADQLFNTKTEIGQLYSIDKFAASLGAALNEIETTKESKDGKELTQKEMREIFNKHYIDKDTTTRLLDAGITSKKVLEDEDKKQQLIPQLDRILSDVRTKGFNTDDNMWNEVALSVSEIIQSFGLLTTQANALKNAQERLTETQDQIRALELKDVRTQEEEDNLKKLKETETEEQNNINGQTKSSYGKRVELMTDEDFKLIARDALNNQEDKKLIFNSIQGTAKRMNTILSPFFGMDIGNGIVVNDRGSDLSYSTFSGEAYRDYKLAKSYRDANPDDIRASVMYQQASGAIEEIDKAYLINMKQSIDALTGENEFAPNMAQSLMSQYEHELGRLKNWYDSVDQYQANVAERFGYASDIGDRLFRENAKYDEITGALLGSETIDSILSSLGMSGMTNLDMTKLNQNEKLKEMYDSWYKTQLAKNPTKPVSRNGYEFNATEYATSEDIARFMRAEGILDIRKLFDAKRIEQELKDYAPTTEEALKKFDKAQSGQMINALNVFGETINKVKNNIGHMDTNGLIEFTKNLKQLQDTIKSFSTNANFDALLKGNEELRNAFDKAKSISESSDIQESIQATSSHRLRQMSARLNGETYSNVSVPLMEKAKNLFEKRVEETKTLTELNNQSEKNLLDELIIDVNSVPENRQDRIKKQNSSLEKNYQNRISENNNLLEKQKAFGKIQALEDVIAEDYGISLNKISSENIGEKYDSIIRSLNNAKFTDVDVYREKKESAKEKAILDLKEKYRRTAELNNLDIQLKDEDFRRMYEEDLKEGRVKVNINNGTSELEKRYDEDIKKIKHLKSFAVNVDKYNSSASESAHLYSAFKELGNGEQTDKAFVDAFVNSKLKKYSETILSLEESWINENDEGKKAQLRKDIDSFKSSEDKVRAEAEAEAIKELENNKLSSLYNATKNISKYTGDDTFSTNVLVELYFNKAKEEIEAAKKALEEKIKGGDTSAQKSLDELNAIDDNVLKQNIKDNVDLQKQRQKELADFRQSNYVFKNANSGKRAYNAAMMRFGRPTLSQQGDYTIDNIIHYIESDMQGNYSALTDMDNNNHGIDFKTGTGKNGEELTEQQKAIYEQYVRTNSIIKQQQELVKKLQGVYGTSFSTIIGLLEKANNVVQRFISNIGRKALQEAVNFSKQFSAAMTEIQMISLKTDEQMGAVADTAIQKAKNLKVSISSITKIQAALYRQGLSDSEVNSRTDVIAKYSAVTGQDITSSLKSLTVAVSSGLVENLEKAADVLVALGDAAATTAAEIARGLQKSATAAKNAGMSYEELTALLTVGTSKTQLGGAQIGRSLNSILSRMTRVTNEGYSSSSDGTVSINDVEQALANVGVALREDKDTFRSATEVLLDLAGVWEDLSDVQRANVSYTLAGTTQTNVFQTVLSAMAEDDTYAELLGKAKNSEGTLDSKYEIIKESLAASMTSLKNAFDSLVENLSPIVSLFQVLTNILSTVISGFSELGALGSIAGFTTGIAALVAASKVIPKIITSLLGLGGAAAGLKGAAASLTSAAVALGGSAATNTAANAGATGIGALLSKGASWLKSLLAKPWVIATVAAVATTAAVVAAAKQESSSDYNNDVIRNTNESIVKSTTSDVNSIFTELNNIIENSYTTSDGSKSLKDSLTDAGFDELENAFSVLSTILPDFTNGIDLTTITLDEFREKISDAAEATNRYTTQKTLETLGDIDYTDYKIIKDSREDTFENALKNYIDGTATADEIVLAEKILSVAKSADQTIVNSGELSRLGYNSFLTQDEFNAKVKDKKVNVNDIILLSKNSEEITDTDVGKIQEKYLKNTSAGLYTVASKELSDLGFSEETQKILGESFVSELGDEILSLSPKEIKNKWKKWVKDNIIDPIGSFEVSAEDITKQYSPHKYAIVGDESGTYYYSKEDAVEAAFGNERNVYDITTGKIVGSSAQDYLDTTSYSRTEQINKLNFAAYVSTFDDIGKFFNDINSSSENIEKYASYLSDENLSKAALEVASGTKEFSYFIDKVNEFVGSVLEEIAYSTENIKNIETYSESYNLNNKVKNKTASSDEMNQYRISNGLPAWWTDEQVSAYASYNTEQQAATLNEVPTNFANELINIIATNLEQKGFDSNAIALMLSKEKTMSGLIQIAKDNEVVLPEYYEAMASLMDSQYAYSVPNRNTNINVVDIDKTDSEVWTGYHGSIGGTVVINPTTGEMTLLSDVVDGNGNLQYLNEAETSRYSASEWKNDKVSKVKDNNSEKVYEVQTDEGGTYITLDDGNKDYIYGMMANSSVGNYYTGTYSMSGSAIPLTTSQLLANASLTANTSFLRTQASDYLDLLLRLQNGESPEDVFNSLDDNPTLQNYALSNGFGQLQNLYTNNTDDYYAQLTSDIESAQEAKRQLAAIGITDSTVASYITSSTRSGQLSAVSSIVERNQNDFRAAELLAKIENGTATADDYSEYASLTNANIQEIKSNPGSARKYYSAYNSDTEKQKSEFNAYAKNTMKNFLAGNNIDISQFESTADMVAYIADETNGADEATRKLAEDWLAVNDGTNEAAKSTLIYSDALLSAKKNIDIKQAKEDMLDYISSAEFSMMELDSRINSNETWANIIAGNEEAAEIMEKYRQGITLTGDEAERLTTILSGLGNAFSYEELDSSITSLMNAMNGFNEDNWNDYQKTFKDNFYKLDEAEQNELLSVYGEGINSIINARDFNEFQKSIAVLGSSQMSGTINRGLGNDVSTYFRAMYDEYADYLQNSALGNNIDANAWIESKAQEYSTYKYNRDIINSARKGESKYTAEEIKSAQDYFGGYKYNSWQMTSVLEDYGAQWNSIIETIFNNITGFWTSVANNTDALTNGVSRDATINGAYDATQQASIDTFYEWIKKHPSANWETDYLLWDDIKNIPEIAELYSNQGITQGDKNWEILNMTSSAKRWGVSEEISDDILTPIIDAMIMGDFGGAQTLIEGIGEEGIYSITQILSQIESKYGSDVANLLKGGANREDYETIMSKGIIGYKKELLGKSYNSGEISQTAYNIATQMLDLTGANELDIEKFKNETLGSWLAEAQTANDKTILAERYLSELDTYTTDEGRKAFIESTGYTWDNNLTFDENIKRFKEQQNTTITSGAQTRKDLAAMWNTATAEQRAAYEMPATEEEFYAKYGFNPTTYEVNGESYQNPDYTIDTYEYSGKAYESRLAYDVSSSTSSADFLSRVDSDADYKKWINSSDALKKIYKDLSSGAILWGEAQAKINKELGRDNKTISEYQKNTRGLVKSYKEALYYADKKSIDRTKGSQDMEYFQTLLGVDYDYLKNYTDDELREFARQEAQIGLDAMNEAANEAAASYKPTFTDLGEGQYEYALGDIKIVPGEIIDMDINAALEEARKNNDLATAAIIEEWIKAGAKTVTRSTVITGSGDEATLSFKYNLTSGSGISGARSSSSGGGGKSTAQKLIDKWKNRISVNEHRIKMLDAEAEGYKNEGELTNYGSILGYKAGEEKKLISEYNSAIKELKAQMGKEKKNSDDWITLRDQVRYSLTIQ